MRKILNGVIIGAIILAVLYFFKWDKINWGKIQLMQAESVTVTGEAQGQQRSQIAHFSASVNSIKDKKEDAIKEVNEKMAELTQKVKDFGISDKDLKTQNISIYQEEESYNEGGRRKTRPGQWRVSNSLEITLRDVNKASDLTNLLASSGATNVWGPSFYVDETTSIEADLMNQAFLNAQEKAGKIAQASGKKLGKVISITEGVTGGGGYPLYRAEGIGAGGGASVEPGATTVSKTVTVVFELK